MSQQLQYFTQNLFILINQRKFFLCLKQREKRKLILLTISLSTAE